MIKYVYRGENMLTEKEIGQRIRKIRNDNNLDQKDFAKKIGTTVSSLSNWENGRNYPKEKFIDKICKEFNVSKEETFSSKRWSDEEINKIMDGLKVMKKSSINSLKEYLIFLSQSELSYTQASYLSNAIQFMNKVDKEELIFMSVFLRQLHFHKPNPNNTIDNEANLQLINETKKEINEFIDSFFSYKNDGEKED